VGISGETVIRVTPSEFRKGSIAIIFGDRTVRHVSAREAVRLARNLAVQAVKMVLALAARVPFQWGRRP